jgi:hypothetical protein
MHEQCVNDTTRRTGTFARLPTKNCIIRRVFATRNAPTNERRFLDQAPKVFVLGCATFCAGLVTVPERTAISDMNCGTREIVNSIHGKITAATQYRYREK